ncbi:DNA cytosine methyltransferase [Anaerococcus sp. AGMB00486]|uniref:Cytosine-specific methyltransferase n=1 Tax=Anaerococcus faecalis TaxID=2742993 RepID=A0ABX2NAF8_9FIRM|nr:MULTISPECIES: DNA cytosine methyltransferase [Anaerococcus]MDD7305398.1 DNA cytosine methyltransferase [Peptoniphilaceae bacterium]MDY3007239.1 DNA cytosine methyltransferase [Anaerococcus porci]NVF11655.1 DNA cytosine methyltransferase [Anaerococcus faecalis]
MIPKVIDLFAGAGGLSLGFMDAGFEIVLANEIDKSIAESYIKNHPSTKMIIGDITKLDIYQNFIPYKNVVDVIIGGPPCQGFSQKGKRKTINDERNYLFQYFVKVVSIVKPKYFVMENVPNILTSENGLFIEEINELFSKIGYFLEYGVLNAYDFGVPQNRRRAIILGKYKGIPPKLPTGSREKVSIWDAISDLNFLNSGEGEEKMEYEIPPQTRYQKRLRKDSKILYNHKATKHSKLVLERLSMIPPNGGKDSLPAEHLTKSIYSGTWSRMKIDEPSVTITTRFDTPSSGQFTHPYLNRSITVREAARIQSFPDTFIFIGTKSSQMRQVGNAVPPLLARNIARVIIKDIEERKND